MSHDTLKTIATVIKNLSVEEFVRHHPHPFLLGMGTSTTASKRAFQTMAGARPLDELAPSAESELPVHQIMKSGRNTFGNMITLGRSDNNDVVLEHPSVSKFHAYFTPGPDGETYSICDADSRFGTFVENRRLRPSTPRVLGPGEAISFGKGPRLTFYPSRDFYDYVKVLESLGKV